MSRPFATECPVCGRDEAVEIVVVEDVPALCNAFGATESEARTMPRGDIELVVCPVCGMLRNRAFDPTLAPYDSEYENSLHFSGRFRDFADALADDLVARHGVAGGTVLEIGSGRGDFLGMVAARGFALGVGVDPSLVAEQTLPAGDSLVRLLPGTAGHVGRDLGADLVLCRHVLEHVADPVGLLRDARRSARPGAAVYVEVPDATYMLAMPAVWDLIYEHPGYFTEGALRTAAALAGWDVSGSGSTFGGQYLWLEAVAPPGDAMLVVDAQARAADTLSVAQRFRHSRAQVIGRWRSFLGAAATARRRLAVWGAGSKGVAFLNTFPDSGAVVVDVSPRKQGRHVPGTGQRVLAPDEAAGLVDLVVVMNPLYLAEVEKAGHDAGLDADYVAVDP